jgi:CheY-like chemotaxis protein
MGKVLLVDDDIITNFLHKNMIEENLTEDIEIASDGKEALDVIHKCLDAHSCPELILLDINMPVMNGFEFLEAFQKMEEKPQSNVFLLTSSLSMHDLDKAKEYNVKGYLSKPLTEDKLKRLVDTIH